MVARYGLMSGLRRYLLPGVGLIFLLQAAGTSAQAPEASLRVAFVYNFLKFIEWPNLQGPDLFLCAVGAREATRQSLGQINNKDTRAVTIRVLFLDDASQLEQKIHSCHMLYVPVSGAALSLPQTMPEGVLLVMDEPNSKDERVGIALRRSPENRIEFMVNELAIKQAGVRVSSQLLKLAKKESGGAS